MPIKRDSQKLKQTQHDVSLPKSLFFKNKISSNSEPAKISCLKRNFAKLIFSGL